MPGASGMLTLFNQLKSQYDENYVFYIKYIPSAMKLINLLEGEEKPKKRLLIGLFSENYEDFSWLIYKLNDIYLTTQFENLEIITTLTNVYNALRSNTKILFKSLNIASLLEGKVLHSFVADFCNKNNIIIGSTDIDLVKKLSRGILV